jgi:hypothetical protein
VGSSEETQHHMALVRKGVTMTGGGRYSREKLQR